MPFPERERDAMLALHGVGAAVVGRLEQIGYHSLAGLRDADPDDVCTRIAAHLRAACWRNSPQARASIAAIVRLARESG